MGINTLPPVKTKFVDTYKDLQSVGEELSPESQSAVPSFSTCRFSHGAWVGWDRRSSRSCWLSVDSLPYFENSAQNTTWTGRKTPAPPHSTPNNKPERWPGGRCWIWLLVFSRVKLLCDLFTCLAWGAHRFCLAVSPVCVGQHFSARTCLPGTFHSRGQCAQLPATALS